MHILLVLALLAAAGCRPSTNTVSMDTVRAEGEPTLESWGAHFTVSQVPVGEEASRRRFEIRAGYLAEYTRGDSTYTLLRTDPERPEPHVTAYLYDAADDTSATLTAQRVLYFEADRRLEARGDVVVVAREGRRLESEHLVWHEDDHTVRTPGFVRIITPTEQVEGYGLEADEDLATYRLLRVTANVMYEDE